MKKLFFTILLKISNWLIHRSFELNTLAENKLAEIEKKNQKTKIQTPGHVELFKNKVIEYVNFQIEKNKIKNILENVIAFFVFGCFIVIFTFVDFCPNIQDVKVKQNKKVIVEIDEDFQLANKNFTFLESNKDVWDFIKIAADEENIDPMLVLSFIQYESGDHCNNNWKCMQKAVSRSGARGPMQIMPFHAPDPDDLFDWKYNIKKGIWYLKACLEASGGNIKDAARRYNQGIYGNPYKYRNWKYVARINNKYKQVLTQKVMVANI